MAKSDDGERNGKSASKLGTQYPARAGVSHRLDHVFDVLGAARRRYLLYYLYEMDGAESTLERAVEAVRRYDSVAVSPERVPLRQSIRVSLAHDHLPRLDAADVLEYDRRRGTIRFHGYPPLEAWLEETRRLELG